MRKHRFIGDFDLYQEIIEISDSEITNQIFKVFRLRKGDSLILCDGKGMEADAVIESVGKGASFIISDIRTSKKDNIERVLLCSILKKENFELVCQKATEIGIDRIIPIISNRTIKLDIRPDRLLKIIREATEQSGRMFLPTLEKPIEFSEAIKMEFDQKVFLSLGGDGYKKDESSLSRAVMVGPEGGWVDDEINLAKENNWSLISLEENILRGETAAIIGSYLII